MQVGPSSKPNTLRETETGSIGKSGFRGILVSIFHMLVRGLRWQGFGADFYDRRDSTKLVARLTQRLHKPGYQVPLTAAPRSI